ncbi:aminotransferase class IV family protein [Telluribacter sp. SYSU D00476]|uniref:aminotransferase class IV family protein n=1 Tax=Telluribacter sp. SYSU D00476 TaxID=2811430 RepID=UPI001FF68F58|nr:aminotransferase class IV family protein [Telluribacter sp. SYSU D00476]
MQAPLCFETICVRNRRLINLPYHQARLHRTRTTLWGSRDRWSLTDLLSVPDSLSTGTYKCRLTYGQQVENIEWEPYTPRPIRSLRVVYDDSIDYSHKYRDRQRLNALAEQRGTCDDVLIVRQGLVTDTSYCNVAFYDGERWLTPSAPLLPGTQRAFLLDQRIIQEAPIKVEELHRFSEVKLFNAMLSWEEGTLLVTDQIMSGL